MEEQRRRKVILIYEEDGGIAIVKLNDTVFEEVGWIGGREGNVGIGKSNENVTIRIGLLGGVMLVKYVEKVNEEEGKEVEEVYRKVEGMVRECYFKNGNVSFEEMGNVLKGKKGNVDIEIVLKIIRSYKMK